MKINSKFRKLFSNYTKANTFDVTDTGLKY